MIPVLSREQSRAFDRHVIEDRGVPSLTLMENAGRGAAEVVARAVRRRGGDLVVLAGSGNNGGDAFVVARRLLLEAIVPKVLLGCEVARLRGDARVNYDAFIAVGGEVTDDALATGRGALVGALEGGGVVVDGLLGTGLDRNVTGLLAEVIEAINRAPGYRIALDVPSGLCADTGRVLGTAVRADETVSFGHPKRGLLTPGGADRVGRLTVVDIGVPAALAEVVGYDAEIPQARDVARLVPARPRSSHKGRSGRVVVIAGSPGKIGAALLAARGASRAGAGLVTIASRPETARGLDLRVLESMTATIDPGRVAESVGAVLAGADAVVLGPGLGLDAEAAAIVEHVALEYAGRVVVDADALTLLAGRLNDLKRAAGPRLLTPHPGEMARLLGADVRQVEGDRFAAVQRAVEASGAAVLLKGAHTLIGAPGLRTRVNPTGSATLAVGGAGDVLAGIVGAMSAGEPALTLVDAAVVAAYLHGRVAERWSEATGADRGMLAREIADGLPGALAELRGATGR